MQEVRRKRTKTVQFHSYVTHETSNKETNKTHRNQLLDETAEGWPPEKGAAEGELGKGGEYKVTEKTRLRVVSMQQSIQTSKYN